MHKPIKTIMAVGLLALASSANGIATVQAAPAKCGDRDKISRFSGKIIKKRHWQWGFLKKAQKHLRFSPLKKGPGQ